jgi:hypothetical protein
LKEIGKSAFGNCGMKSIEIPNQVEKIGDRCFYKCESLSEVRFQLYSHLKEMGEFVFEDCQVRKIEIPSKCESVTGGSLRGLEIVIVSGGNNSLVQKDSLIVNKRSKTLVRYFGRESLMVIENCIERIGDECFCFCRSLCEVIFESGCNLKEIDKFAFQNVGLNQFVFQRVLKRLESVAFLDANLLLRLYLRQVVT